MTEAYERIYRYPSGSGGLTVLVDEDGLASLPEPLLHLVMVSAGFREVE